MVTDAHLLGKVFRVGSMDEIVGLHAVVHGKVQGVGFRAFTHWHAQEKGLLGWVQNCQDGTVEVEAEGRQESLESFIKLLEKGPPFSTVTKVDVDWKAANRQTYEFTIRRG